MFLSLIGALYGLDANRFDCIRLDDDHTPHELTGKKMYFALSYQYEYESKCLWGMFDIHPAIDEFIFFWKMKSVKVFMVFSTMVLYWFTNSHTIQPESYNYLREHYHNLFPIDRSV